MNKERPLRRFLRTMKETEPSEPESNSYMPDGDGIYLSPKTIYEIEADLNTKIKISK